MYVCGVFWSCPVLIHPSPKSSASQHIARSVSCLLLDSDSCVRGPPLNLAPSVANVPALARTGACFSLPRIHRALMETFHSCSSEPQLKIILLPWLFPLRNSWTTYLWHLLSNCLLLLPFRLGFSFFPTSLDSRLQTSKASVLHCSLWPRIAWHGAGAVPRQFLL